MHPEWDQFVRFTKEEGPRIYPFRTEWRIWSDEYRLAGTIDLISRNEKDGESYSLYDWKRTKHSIEQSGSCFGKYGQGPLKGVPDTKFNRFRLQLSLYKRILELHYGIHVTDLYLVPFHPNAKDYQVVKVVYWPEYVDKLLAHRRKQIPNTPSTDDTGLESALELLAILD